MSNKNFSVNIDDDAVKNQYEQEQKTFTPKKTQFDTKNYLQARLEEGENSKTLTIRLLPFSPEGSGTAFHKIHMHQVRVNKEVSASGWKTFVCPTKNEVDGHIMGDKCPFCEISAKARELKRQALDEPTKKKYGDIEFLNRAKDMWIVRCIERGHEEDGVKFWLFPDNKQGKGVYDQIRNLAKVRREAAAAKGNKYSIYDVNNGLDLIIMLTRGSDNKTAIQVMDGGIPCPLTEDYELGLKWIKDTKKWYEVYTVKPYDFMSIIAEGSVPIYNKELKKYVSKEELSKLKKESEEEKQKEVVSATKDYSSLTEPSDETIIDGSKYDTSGDEDIPF